MALFDPITELTGDEAKAFQKAIENPKYNEKAAAFLAFAQRTFNHPM